MVHVCVDVCPTLKGQYLQINLHAWYVSSVQASDEHQNKYTSKYHALQLCTQVYEGPVPPPCYNSVGLWRFGACVMWVAPSPPS